MLSTSSANLKGYSFEANKTLLFAYDVHIEFLYNNTRLDNSFLLYTEVRDEKMKEWLFKNAPEELL